MTIDDIIKPPAKPKPRKTRHYVVRENSPHGKYTKEGPTFRRAGDIAKDRVCLLCRVPFPSRWSGERVCRSCKGGERWRTGLVLSTTQDSQR